MQNSSQTSTSGQTSEINEANIENTIVQVSENNKELAIITCFLGMRITKILPAPNKYECYFFTNNPLLKDLIIKKNWKYIYINVPLFNSAISSSLQSKTIKFLKFLQLEKFKYFYDYKKLLYIDHKHLLTDFKINRLLDVFNASNKSILIRYCPVKNKRPKNLIDEYNQSLYQERYNTFRNITVKYIQKMVNQNKCSPYIRVCCTGLILYDLTSEISLKCANETFRDIMMIRNPQCQIIWNLVTQKYNDYILKLDYTDIFIKRYEI